MDLNKTWLGIAIGGGASAIYGKSGYILQFLNCAHPTSQVSCVVGGVRAGLAIHANCGVSFALLTGVGGPKDLERAQGGGYDFAIDLGIRFGDIVKSGGYIGMAIEDGIKELNRLFYTTDLAAWIGSERGKAFINALLGELSPSNTVPTLCMFGTPAGAGLGAGIWYEYQSVYEVGAMSAWACVPLAWRLHHYGGDLWLQVKDIPAKDGSEIIFFGKEFCYGLDGVMHFAEPKRIRHSPSDIVSYKTYSSGIVIGNKLQEKPSFQKGRGAPPPDGGINLSLRSLQSSRGLFYNSDITSGSTMNMGIGIRFDGQLVWESYTSTQVVVGNSSLSTITPQSNWQY